MSNATWSRQFWVEEPGRGEILRRELPPKQDHEVLVRARYSGISRGTEALVFQGHVPASQYLDMRAPFQEGSFPGPVKYGYSSVGEVLAPAGPGTEYLVGKTVFCLFPHQDLYHVPAAAVRPLPSGLPPERAVLGANMETAVNAVWDGGPGVGDRIVVIGLGVVGLLIGWLCRRLPATEVVGVDTNGSREGPAVALGIPFHRTPPQHEGADVVFHASGSPHGLRSALEAAGSEASVIEVSWYGDESVCLPLGEAFHSRRLALRSSQVGRLPSERRARWSTDRRMNLALNLLLDPALDVLTTGEDDFEDLPEVMKRLSEEPSDTLCHRIRYPNP
jgi:threonine dehydrogenase-like Zn-dependent dehydrogenase